MSYHTVLPFRADKDALAQLETKLGTISRSEAVRDLIHQINTSPEVLLQVLTFKLKELYNERSAE
jgi:hypothetical protein